MDIAYEKGASGNDTPFYHYLALPGFFSCGPMKSEGDEQKITIDDIARAAKVSKSTVSRVLNNRIPVHESKRKAVERAMERLKFQPNVFARGLAGGSSMTIGVVTQNIGSPFYDAVARGILEGLVNTSYSPIFTDGRWEADVERGAINTLLGRQVDGIVIVGGTISADEMNVLKTRKPTVVVARMIEGWGKQCILVDNREAARKATAYLIQSGHRRIAHIQGISDHQDAIHRYEGFCDALRDAKIEPNPKLVVEGNFSGQSGLLAVESLISRGVNFTAIFAANDEMAMGARLALFRRGIRVPDDISLVGFDDQPHSLYMTPPLTTVRQPAVEMGVAAANAMLSLLTGDEIGPHQFEARLMIRETVASPR